MEMHRGIILQQGMLKLCWIVTPSVEVRNCVIPDLMKYFSLFGAQVNELQL